MSQIVHVIKPSGTAFQYTFPDHYSPEQILEELNSIKGHFGFNGTVKKKDPNFPHEDAPEVDMADPTSGFAFDHKDTVVAILETKKEGGQIQVVLDESGKPVESKRLKGPPKKVEAPPTEEKGPPSEV